MYLRFIVYDTRVCYVYYQTPFRTINLNMQTSDATACSQYNGNYHISNEKNIEINAIEMHEESVPHVNNLIEIDSTGHASVQGFIPSGVITEPSPPNINATNKK